MSADKERLPTAQEPTQEAPAKVVEDIFISSALTRPQEKAPLNEDVVIGEITYADCFPKSTKPTENEIIH